MYRKIALVAVAGIAAAGVSASPAAAATRACRPSTCSWEIQTHFWEKTETSKKQQYVMTKTAKVQVLLSWKQHNHSVGVRLVTCGAKKALTGWRDLKVGGYWWYTFDKKVKKGTCFRVQAGRSDAGTVRGDVRVL